jgi:hypothetical protein
MLSVSLMLWAVSLAAYSDDSRVNISVLRRKLIVLFLSFIVLSPVALRSMATMKILECSDGQQWPFVYESIINAKGFTGFRYYHVVSKGYDVAYEGFDAGKWKPIKHGLFRISKSGRILHEMAYRLNQRNGRVSSWWDSGSVKVRGNYANDNPAGKWEFHDEADSRYIRVQFTESGIAKVIDAAINGGDAGSTKSALNTDDLKNLLSKMSIDWSYYE